MTGYDLMRVANFDSSSPFYEMVNLGEKKVRSKIEYKTMVQLATAWYSGEGNAVQRVLKSIYPTVQGPRSKRIRLTRWTSDEWGDFFLGLAGCPFQIREARFARGWRYALVGWSLHPNFSGAC